MNYEYEIKNTKSLFLVMEICLRMEDEPGLLEKIIKITSPENDDRCKMSLESGELLFCFHNEKLASIYSVIDEILRAYEIVKNIESQDFTPGHQV